MCDVLKRMIPVSPHGEFAPNRDRPHYNLSILSSPPTFRTFLATSNLITQWIKERGIISLCDSIWLGANLIKVNRCGGEISKGRNRQLPLKTKKCGLKFSAMQHLHTDFVIVFPLS